MSTAMIRFLLAYSPLLLAGAVGSIGADGNPEQWKWKDVRGQPPNEPHFLTSTDSFLRTSSSRVGQAVARILGVQGSLDDMRNDLSGEYQLWQHKKESLADEKARLQNETARLRTKLLEQRSLGEEKLRLQSQLAFHQSETKKAADALTEKQHQWKPHREAFRRDIEVLEEHLKSLQARKLEQLSAIAKKTSDTQDRNRALQTEIFTLNKQVGDMQRQFANRTIINKQRHSVLLSEVEKLQTTIHALQDQVISRAQVQLEVQRHWQRFSAQASEVVTQKEELQKTRVLCEKEIQELEAPIHAAQSALKQANQQMAECQRLDAEAQGLQGSLNECRAQAQAGRSL